MSLMAVTKVPPARPMAPPPRQRVNRPPKPHAPGKVPDPRRPRVVPDIAGNELGDLFLFFADLPWAPRPPRRLFTRLLVFAVILTGSVAAHHSFSTDYYENQSVTLEGEIEQFQYRNPHAWVMLRVREHGKDVTYGAEWSGVTPLRRFGITAETLKAGDRVRIQGAPGRNPELRRVHLKAIERPADGWSWSFRANPPVATEPAATGAGK